MRRGAAVTAVVLVFALAWASIAFAWPPTPWLAPIACGLLAGGVIVGATRFLVRRHRRTAHMAHTEHTAHTASTLAASDDYSDLQLGRRPPTHPPRDEASTSQIGDPPPPPPTL